MSVLRRAAELADWQQVVLNGGPPCFYLGDGEQFCLRAERWPGHPIDHAFLPLAEVIAAAEARGAALAVEQVRRMAEDWARRQDAVATTWSADAESELGREDATFRKGCEARVHIYADFARELREFARRVASPDLAEEVRRIEERGAGADRERTVELAAKVRDEGWGGEGGAAAINRFLLSLEAL